jgi:pyruvate/2-oxoglutarate/acetoin dehydrogenase E1 component
MNAPLTAATTYAKSLNAALLALMHEDERIHFLGEDILDPYGGAFKISKGLSSAFPDRVITTPISEAGFTGLATGMALRGLRPIVEIMFGDFLAIVADQIINHMAKFVTMYGRDLEVPVVVRTPMGGGRGYGATHSQSLEKLFLGTPNLTVVAPSHAHDPGKLLRNAAMLSRPVLFIEHKMLYPEPLVESGGALTIQPLTDEAFPTVLMKNFSHGSADVLIVAYGGMSRLLAPLAGQMAEEEINLVIALPSLLSPMTVQPLLPLATECGRILVVEEGTAGFDWGAEVAAQLYAATYRNLKAPIARLASRPEIIPTSTAGENAMLVSAADIESKILELLA